jgi:hypothetical protein
MSIDGFPTYMVVSNGETIYFGHSSHIALLLLTIFHADCFTF